MPPIRQPKARRTIRVEPYLDGHELRRHVTYVDGVANGPVDVIDNTTGRLVQRYTMRNGKPHGADTRYHENGAVHAINRTKDGVEHGLCKIFRPDGSLMHTARWRNGICISTADYDANGKRLKPPKSSA